MSNLTDTFSDIADAIRNKNGSSNTYTPAQMPAAIAAIPTGGGSYQSKTVSPSISQQTVTADSGYDALSSVIINAMPTTTSPQPTIIVNNNTGLITASHTQTTGYISQDTTTTKTYNLPTHPGGTYNPEDLDATYDEEQDMLTLPIPLTIPKGTMLTNNLAVNTTDGYVSNQIPRRSSSDLTASGATVTVPAGYYSSQATKSISSGSATAPAVISGSSAAVTTGTNTITLAKSVSVTPTVTAGYVSSGTAGDSIVSLTASVTTKAAETITPSTTNQTIAANTYLTGAQTISGDANLVSGNIKSGTSIFGIIGTYSGGESNPLKFGVIRPDAELWKTYSYDANIVEDEGVTIPAYNTSTQTLKASSTVEAVALDLSSYRYYVLQRMLTIPTYNTTATAKGRTEWVSTSALYEICSIDPNTCHALVDPTKKIGSRSSSCMSAGTFPRHCYWSSASAVALYTSAAYGPYQAVQAPSLSTSGTTSGTLTLKSPIFNIRGSTSYYTSTYWSATTDIRFQWVIDVYRVPANTTSLEGWGMVSQLLHSIDCAQSTNHTLT